MVPTGTYPRRPLGLVLLAVALFVSTACGGKQGNPKSAEGSRAAEPIPSDLAAFVQRSSDIGRTLHVYDAASAIGTDVLLSKVSLAEHPLGGYVTLAEGDEQGKATGSFSVIFYTRDADPRIAFRIQVHPGANPPDFEAVKPPADAPEPLRSLIRARETALDAPRDTNQPMNPVVLPGRAIGESGMLVYLIAGTKQPKVAVLGKHYRVLVSEDGRTVKRTEPLSKTVFELPYGASPGSTTAALAITHLVTDYPLETHVFASLLYRLPIHVATARGLWRVDGATISFHGPLPEKASR
jgi:hypothetical protein